MPNAPAIQRLEERLLELGCPIKRAELHVREIADHHEDLRLQGLEDGLSEADAERRANQLLGEPVALADHLARALRQSSWWGRHRVIGFCFLPPVGVFTVSLLGLTFVLALLRLCFSSSEWSVLAEQGEEFHLVAHGVQGACYLGTAIVAALFCWLARRSVAGQRWALAACAVCALQSYFGYCRIAPHAVSIGYSFDSDWIAASIPMLVGLIAVALQQRTRRPVTGAISEPAEASLPGDGSFTGANLDSYKQAFSSPTYWVLGLVVVSIAFVASKECGRVKAAAVHHNELLNHQWPAERAEVRQHVKAHQIARTQFTGSAIDLRPYLNDSLLDEIGRTTSPGEDDQPPGNNLAELPRGLHTFGDVPFVVQGRIQLMGRGFTRLNRAFPSRARGIHVGSKCSLIHLLHGAAFVPAAQPVQIASLILHYEDGSRGELEIIAGRDVLDWWGPIMTTGVARAERETTSPLTELAWVGSNARLRAAQPELSLRLYRSSFINPRPDLELTSIDYVSTLTDAAPFLVGLTVE